MRHPAVLFALPIEASPFIHKLTDLKEVRRWLYEGNVKNLTVRVGISGMGSDLSASKARELLSGGAEFLIICGFAAGLDDSLASGDLVVAGSVIDVSRGRSMGRTCDRQLASLALGICGGGVQGVIGVHKVIHSPLEKAELAEMFQCAAADMESWAAASVASESGMPFAIVRAVVDSSRDAVPRELSSAMLEDGRIKVGRLISGLLMHPQILAPAAGLALRSRRCAHRLADFLVEFLPSAVQAVA